MQPICAINFEIATAAAQTTSEVHHAGFRPRLDRAAGAWTCDAWAGRDPSAGLHLNWPEKGVHFVRWKTPRHPYQASTEPEFSC
jgi:hypothetical protein